MSANVKTKPRIRWDDEGAWLKLADLPYEASEEVADGFIVDASPDRRVTGLEILWPAAERSGYAKEPALAFGLFCAALAGLSWQYNDYLRSPVEMRNPLAGIYSQLKGMIDAIGVEIQVSLETLIPAHSRANLLDLAILDSNGNPLICAAIKRGKFQRGTVQRYTELLKDITASDYPNAIGIGVFIDETGHGNRSLPVEPGVWTDWFEITIHGGTVWAHNTIIPPTGCRYPWLPKELRDPMLKAVH